MLNRHPDKIISDLDYNTYLDLFDNMVLRELVFPQLMIYLDVRPETAAKRIGARGRGMEQQIPLDYLRALNQNYEQFIAEMDQAGVRILRIDWESFQPISEVVRLVHEYSLKPSSFTKWVRPLRRAPSSRSDARNDAEAAAAAAAAQPV
jgi:deoxyadenosine/deoxycytidine kinase